MNYVEVSHCMFIWCKHRSFHLITFFTCILPLLICLHLCPCLIFSSFAFIASAVLHAVLGLFARGDLSWLLTSTVSSMFVEQMSSVIDWVRSSVRAIELCASILLFDPFCLFLPPISSISPPLLLPLSYPSLTCCIQLQQTLFALFARLRVLSRRSGKALFRGTGWSRLIVIPSHVEDAEGTGSK